MSARGKDHPICANEIDGFFRYAGATVDSPEREFWGDVFFDLMERMCPYPPAVLAATATRDLRRP